MSVIFFFIAVKEGAGAQVFFICYSVFTVFFVLPLFMMKFRLC